MISMKLLKMVANVGNPPVCSGVIEVPSGPKSHTFTVILAVFAPQLRSGADGGFFDRRGPDIVYGGNIGAIAPIRTANGALF